MFSQSLEDILDSALEQARKSRHELMSVEHLLLALLDDEGTATVLEGCHAKVSRMRRALTKAVKDSVHVLSADSGRDTQPTIGFQRVLQRAILQVQAAGKKEVSGPNVLVAIFNEQDSQAAYILSEEQISCLDVIQYISQGATAHGRSDDSEEETYSQASFEGPQARKKESLLEKFASNLNKHAKNGKIDPLIGRDDEIERLAQTLCRRRKNNPILVGEPGVGKTAIVEGLALKITQGEVPELLKESTVYSVDLGALLAGTKYRGEFEKRLKALLAEIKKEKDAIVFVDEIHTLIGAGATSGGALDASNLIKPLLSRGELRCVGATTYAEFRNVIGKDAALMRRFQKLEVKEPSIDDTIAIIQGLREKFEGHHGVTYTDEAIESAVRLSSRYITDRFQPDKGIDVIDEVGAKQAILKKKDRKKIITEVEIEQAITEIARIPAQRLDSSDKEALKYLDRDLRMLVFGQNEAIDHLAASIRTSRAGLRSGDKPVGSFLFNGPTGVGKTEVCKQLATLLGLELLRFDMSEYMERHTASQLVGSPAGYVGFEQGGLLTEAVSKHPHSVLLLDEVEKAHPDIFNLMLQVMDNGRLTDNTGRSIDFRHVILIMTSNTGAEAFDRSSLGFLEQEHETDSALEVKRMFSPEFRNRLDSVVTFAPLGRDAIQHVVGKFLTELEVQLACKNVTLKTADSAREWLAEHGYNPSMGARPMERLVNETIRQPLAAGLLYGELADGGVVKLTATQKDGIKLSVQAKPATKKKSKATAKAKS